MGRFELDVCHHLISRSLVIKIFLVSATVAVIPILASLREIHPTFDDCDGAPITSGTSLPAPMFDDVVLDLMARNWIRPGDRALSVGRGSGPAAAEEAMKRMGLVPTVGAMEGCGGLPFRWAAFDFVFSAGLDRAVAPARIVLEMERVLRPGRAGAVVVGPARRGGAVGAAEPVAVVVFKKRRPLRSPM